MLVASAGGKALVVQQKKPEKRATSAATWWLEYVRVFLAESSFHGVGFFVHIKTRPFEVYVQI
jgi:hypothetical protein